MALTYKSAKQHENLNEARSLRPLGRRYQHIEMKRSADSPPLYSSLILSVRKSTIRPTQSKDALKPMPPNSPMLCVAEEDLRTISTTHTHARPPDFGIEDFVCTPGLLSLQFRDSAVLPIRMGFSSPTSLMYMQCRHVCSPHLADRSWILLLIEVTHEPHVASKAWPLITPMSEEGNDF